MDLQVAIGLRPGELVAFVGAGGKTTAAWRLLRALGSAGERAVFTATTRIFRPKDGSLMLAPNPSPADVARALDEPPILFLAAAQGEEGDPDHAARSPYPAQPIKLVGLAPEVLDGLVRQLPGVTWLVEADGAKGRLLKAPAEHEPVIPGGANRVVVVACLDAIGRPLDDDTVHRPEIAARLLGVPQGALVSPELVAGLIGHPAGGLKGIPELAEVVVLLTEWSGRSRDDAGVISRHLLSGRRIGGVVLADLSTSGLVVGAWRRD
jgi:molybdenum cofactor cytidylyltransferase